MPEPIQLFVPTFHVEETLEEIRECLIRGWTGLGFKTVEFEEAWKGYTTLPCAHFVNAAAASLHLAVRLLKEQDGWQEGDEVISTALTFVSTNHVTGEGAYKWMYGAEYDGFKYRGNSIMAAIALVGLKYLDRDNAYGRQAARWYDQMFVDEPRIQTMPVTPGFESTRHLYQVMVQHRDEAILALNAQQIYPGVHYQDNSHVWVLKRKNPKQNLDHALVTRSHARLRCQRSPRAA